MDADTGGTTGVRRCSTARLATLGAVAIATLLGVAGCATKAGAEHGTSGARAASEAPSTATPAPTTGPPATFDPRHQLGSHDARLKVLQDDAARAPARLIVPDLHVTAPVRGVGTDTKTHMMQLANDTTTVNWWSPGGWPGDRTGTVVMAAHVDWHQQPGQFFHLDKLRPGATVTVVTKGGARVNYRVTSDRRLPKLDLSSQNLFTPAGPARLALVTCGGEFDFAAHSYLDNVIVYATPES